VAVPGAPDDDVLLALHAAQVAWLPPGTRWADAHTHIGHDDPDGYEADPEEILAGLDRAGQDRALVFPMHEPAGYPPANDRVLAAVAASGGRLEALCRVDPNAPGAVAEARRCLDAGARGVKLHPRSDGFGLPHPVVEEVVALAHERRGVVLFHAGRGIPRLGPTVVDLAHRFPGARLVLAHAGISDVGWIGAEAERLPNLFFDTAWWQVGDLLTLFASVPPARLLYASDMPYGSPRFHAVALLRCGRAVGLEPEQIAVVAGAQLERALAGEEPIDLGPAPGAARLGPRDVGFERVVAHLTTAATLSWRGLDATEAFALARLALHRADGHPLAAQLEALLAVESIWTAATGQLLAGTCDASHTD